MENINIKTHQWKLRLLILAVLSILFSAHLSAQTFTDGDFKFSVIEEGKTCEVTGTTLTSGDLIIPSTATYNGTVLSVVSVGEKAFLYCSGFNGSLTLPESLTSIGNSAFNGCSGFTGSLTIPKNVTSIGPDAFYNCSGFTGSLTLPESLTSIGNGAFWGCSGFTGSLTLPESLTSIGNHAFIGCSGFKGSLRIPDKVTSIGNLAFQDCSNLDGTLILGSSLETLGSYFILQCKFTEIKSLNPIPPTSELPNIVFSGGNKKNATLYVPAGSEAAYAASPVWSGFKFADVEPTGVTLDRTSWSTQQIGATVTLIATVAPDDATDKTVTWSSSTPTVASVDASGKVKALAVGKTTITATTVNGKTATCEVEVKPVEAESVTLSQTTANMTVGDNLTLTATVAPATTTDKTVTWTSSAPTIASVDASGKVTALAVGSATVTAKTANGKEATCSVTVKAKTVAATGISLDQTETQLTEGEALSLTATITPGNATSKTVGWTSSDPTVATVDASGEVTALKAGKTTITASTSNGLTATCVLTVKAAIINATGISIDKTALTLTTGGTAQLTATIEPENTTDTSVTWTTSNPAVATVDASGVVTAVRSASTGASSIVGNATITGTTANGLTAVCRVKVRPRTATVHGIEYRLTYADEGGNRTFATVTGGEADEDGEITIVEEVAVKDGNTEVAIPVTSIEPSAFAGRADITKVIVPETVTFIGNEAFANCANLKEIVIEDASSLLNCGTDVFEGSPFVSLYLGRHTGGTIYSQHHSLDHLEIGELVDVIDEEEFKGCDPITDLSVYATVPPMLPDNGFDESVYQNTYLRVPTESVEAYKEADGWKKFNHDDHIIALDAIPAEAITLNMEELPLALGDSKQLRATITPENVTTKTLRWSSSDEKVASVSANGLVVARKIGTATITVRTTNNLTATCTVTVSPILPEAIAIEPAEATVTEKKSLTLSANITPENVTDDSVTWSSSDEEIATVDEDGVVSALTPGNVTITATTVNGLTATCTVTVMSAVVPVSGITLTRTKVDVELGRSITLRPNISPANATDKTVTWTSSNEKVATVSASGEVNTLSLGNATITVTSVNGLSATCVVTVVPRTETIGGIIYEIVPGGGENGEDVVKVIGGDSDDNGEVRIPEEVEIDGKIYPVTEIGEGAFKGREDITKVVIPPSVVTIGDEAFAGCINLKDVEAEDGEKLLACGEDAFKDCPIKDLYLGRDTSGQPFAGNDSLESVTIGEKVTSIGSGDFGGCTSIKEITVLASTPPTLADDGFDQRVYEQATLFVPDDCVDKYKEAPGWKNFFDILGINEIRVIDIEFELPDLSLTEGESATLKVIITPENATDKKVAWTSSDEEVATVNASGLVSALKAGTATITATTANGLKATCEITVKPKASGIGSVDGDEVPALRVEGGEIVIADGVRAEVFSLTGARVAVVNGGGRVNGLPRGIYIVRTGGKSYKIAL